MQAYPPPDKLSRRLGIRLGETCRILGGNFSKRLGPEEHRVKFIFGVFHFGGGGGIFLRKMSCATTTTLSRNIIHVFIKYEYI